MQVYEFDFLRYSKHRADEWLLAGPLCGFVARGFSTGTTIGWNYPYLYSRSCFGSGAAKIQSELYPRKSFIIIFSLT
jgi:hypothetical protein